MSEATIVIQVDDELKTAFTQAAKALDCSTSQLLCDFMCAVVQQQTEQASYDAWFRQKVERALASVRAGEVFTAAEVEAHFAQRRAASLLKAGNTGS
ncbi:hypothetical protein [Pseudomonas sp. 18175]|uniref:hypothetical protein n=1 Tax=Pseudomonas sp. 18175 TaxID=3390056 RepID=UPI003D219A40